ncbi:uncharacterized protein LOC130900789 [Diorhabda carinulata]|uniref:uncharacterized protein LOC130900789 n=1 Tax=Diorhabda carinulata TaxID=1163345 RepID=UPI0025A2677B|nr:uncharacterized protein LOC130900789 [Diorhabda carinulata]
MTNSEETQNALERRSTRNFIKENVHNIKQIQGVMQMQKGSKSKLIKSDRFRNFPTGHFRRIIPEKANGEQSKFKRSEVTLKAKSELVKTEKRHDILSDAMQKFSHRSVQTERTDDLVSLYETGVIKYASAKPFKSATKNNRCHAEGDYEDDFGEKNHIKKNIENLKPKTIRHQVPKVPVDVPPTYQKGRLPKYLQNKKEEIKEEEDTCPIGHILLPEAERKDTLKLLRESYASRIQELNTLPVRSDTLRVKKRKQEIEEDLKKLDSGIRVFQRPKVFVKIDS